MKCPYCGGVCADDALYCPSCKQPLPTAKGGNEPHKRAREKRSPRQKAFTAVLVVAFAVGFVVGVFKLIGWMQNYQLNRLYTRGAYTPTLSTVKMEDLRQGHAMIFFGKDGDQIYVPELHSCIDFD